MRCRVQMPRAATVSTGTKAEPRASLGLMPRECQHPRPAQEALAASSGSPECGNSPLRHVLRVRAWGRVRVAGGSRETSSGCRWAHCPLLAPQGARAPDTALCMAACTRSPSPRGGQISQRESRNSSLLKRQFSRCDCQLFWNPTHLKMSCQEPREPGPGRGGNTWARVAASPSPSTVGPVSPPAHSQ